MAVAEPRALPAAPGRARALRRLLAARGVATGGALLAALLLGALFGPLLWGQDPAHIDLTARNLGASPAHPLGTDQLGRDLLARLMAGARVSLAVGLSATGLALLIGTGVGLLAGMVRWLDAPLMRLTDLCLALPLLPLLLLMMMLFRAPLAALTGPEGGMFLLMVAAIGLTSWMQIARLLRGEVLRLQALEFTRAARALGVPPARLVARHILPNALSPILVSAAICLAQAILTESALSFLGLGFPPDFPTWGRLLLEAIDHLQTNPGRALWPGGAITATVLGVTLLADGLTEALDPRRRTRVP
ncbi:ABC transporter permease [Poseidonocella sedimentorum]|uniref:Peptide/nickel transport system permease protein n=1 Tax=Poseidonocella sedimentorum TaxID=871652 RepID=A0A1I6CR06_9RHOB|nr:ABC transporter permease [Poseidonocella sedimentorum]SFQ95611.1 peptide/nickel transport system permease protein [Poseidonocella sedimentorum]